MFLPLKTSILNLGLDTLGAQNMEANGVYKQERDPEQIATSKGL